MTTFFLDPLLSEVLLVAEVDGVPFEEQSPGSLTTTFQGALNVDIGEGTIRFLDGLVDADPQPGLFLPGDLPSDFAGQSFVDGVDPIFTAARDIITTVYSSTRPVEADGSFDADGLGFGFFDGRYDYGVPLRAYNGMEPVVATTRTSVTDVKGSLTDVGGALRLTVPLELEFEFYDFFLDASFSITAIGEFVAFDVDVSAPVADDDDYTATEDTELAVSTDDGVLANDSDPQDDVISAVLDTGPEHGAVILAEDGSFNYLPEANYFGPDAFFYRAFDGTRFSEPARVNITVDPIDDAPVAVDDEYFVLEGDVLDVGTSMGLLANDVNVDGDPLEAILDSLPSNGVLELSSDGSFSYIPNDDFGGFDSFTYHANDILTDGAPATVTIGVARPPFSHYDKYTTDEDTPLVVDADRGLLRNDFGWQVSQLRVELIDGPEHGSIELDPDGSFDFVPDENFHGPDVFTYVAGNDYFTGPETLVYLQMFPVDDAPVAVGDQYSTPEDTTLSANGTPEQPSVLANDSDVEDDALVAMLVSGPSTGTLDFLEDGTFDFIPEADFHGAVEFTYQVTAGGLERGLVDQ